MVHGNVTRIEPKIYNGLMYMENDMLKLSKESER